jgi:hypothetical protein
MRTYALKQIQEILVSLFPDLLDVKLDSRRHRGSQQAGREADRELVGAVGALGWAVNLLADVWTSSHCGA